MENKETPNTPNTLETIKEILTRRDGMAPWQADDAISAARERVWEGEDPEEILLEEFGLEPDYIFDLLGGAR